MNKIKLMLSLFLLVLALLFVGCNEKQDQLYNVQFYDGDELLQSIKVKENTTIDKSIFDSFNLSTERKEFMYWLNGESKFNADEHITSDITLKAYYINLYIVKVINGEDIKEYTVKEGEKLSKLEDLTKEGFIFKGYYVDNKLFDFNNPITSDLILLPIWEENICTITFIDDDKTIKTENVKFGSSLKLDTLKKEGYNFKGWEYDGNVYHDSITINTNITLKAVWEEIVYVISFYDVDNLITTREVKYGQTLEDIPSFNKDGYEFMGWDCDFENVKSDLNAYADYYAITYNIFYHNCEKTSNPKTYTIESKDINLVDVETTDTLFGGWYLDSDFKTKIEVIKKGTFGDLNLYAKYLTIYNVNYYLQGGDFSELEIENFNLVKTSVSNIIITEYNSDYWSLYNNNVFLFTKDKNPNPTYSYRIGIKLEDDELVVTGILNPGISKGDLGDHDYVILWSENNSKVTSEANVSKIEIGNVVKTNMKIDSLQEGSINVNANIYKTSIGEYNSKIVEGTLLPEPKRSRYIFKGWMNEENEIITSIMNVENKDITLRAVWETAEGKPEYEIELISDELFTNIGKVVTKNISLPERYKLNNKEESEAQIKWISSNEDIISSNGVVKRVYGNNQTCTLTCEITFKGITKSYSSTVLVPRGYKDLSQGGIIAGYNYTSNVPNDTTLRKVDILYCAFGSAGGDGHITNLNSIGAYVKAYIDAAHKYGDYVVLSIHTSSLAVVASKQSLIDVFVEDCIKAINDFDLDGIDIDWERPTQETKKNYTALMKTLYKKVKANNPENLVTTATAAGPWQYPVFDLENSIQYIDYINLMAYDLQTNSKSTHHSALYKSTKGYTLGQCTIDETLPLYNKCNVPNEKIIVGLPFYGRVFKETNGIGQSSVAGGAVTQTYIYETYLSKRPEGVTIGFDDECKVPYIYDSNQKIFISYDDERSIVYKTEYIAMKGLAGMMYWQNAQDYNNILLNKIYNNKSTMIKK